MKGDYRKDNHLLKKGDRMKLLKKVLSLTLVSLLMLGCTGKGKEIV